MSVRTWFDGLKSSMSPAQRRRTRRAVEERNSAARCLLLESLEDRRLLAFDVAVNYAAGTSPQAVVTADLNADGRLDLAIANGSSNNVSVLLGNADGTFQAAQNSATGAYPKSVAVGDFNGDGKLDLATANAYDVSVLLGSGTGTFAAPTSIGLGSSPSSVAVGDFNGDGKLDLAASSTIYYPGYSGWYGSYPGYYTGRMDVLLGNGLGGFAGPTSTWLGYGYHTGAAAADFNGDGNDDFAMVNSDYAVVYVALGSTGGLGAPSGFTTGYSPRSVAVGDFTGDGIDDLAAAGILKGNGSGAFQWISQSYGHAALAAADFNGDGHLDLATADYGATISVELNDGAGTGTFKPPIDIATGGSGTAGVVVGDFNGDGLPDAASANLYSNNVSALLNDGAWPTLDAPLIFINDVTVNEGNSGATSATFTVTLTSPSNQTVTVDYATLDGSASSASDYQSAAGTLTFAPGVSSETITVLVNGDRAVEYGESFYVKLSDATNAFVADVYGFGSITDDEPRLSIDYGPIVISEGNSGETTAVFSVRLSAPSDEPVSVNFSTAEGDTQWWGGSGYYYYYGPPAAATTDSDFEGQSGTVTFAPGETVKTIPITIYGDRLAEADEYFSVDLSGSTSGTIDSAHAVGVIVDDEPYAMIDSVSKLEGNTGTTAFTFNVTLSAASDADVTVNYNSLDGSATSASGDYQAVSGTLTFTPGQTSKTITVQVNGDRAREFDEYFYLLLPGAGDSGYDALGYGTIVDDEPRLTINDVYKAEGNSGTTVFRFTVSLSAAYDQAVTVNFKTVDGTAKAGTDYQAKTGTLTFAAGETVKFIDVLVTGETTREVSEYFQVQLTNPSSNTALYDEWGLGNINNDDTKPGKRNGRK